MENLGRGRRLEDLIRLDSYPVQTSLRLLLQDKTTKKILYGQQIPTPLLGRLTQTEAR